MIARRTLVTGTLATFAAPSIVSAQGAPIRLVVPYGPGGSTDTAGRVLAERMSQDTGRTIVVENRPGGGTMVGMVNIAKSKPDGTSLMVLTTTAALQPAFDIPMQIDPQKDLAPIAQLADIPCVLAVNASNPAKTFAEFIEWVKAQPDCAFTQRTRARGHTSGWSSASSFCDSIAAVTAATPVAPMR